MKIGAEKYQKEKLDKITEIILVKMYTLELLTGEIIGDKISLTLNLTKPIEFGIQIIKNHVESAETRIKPLFL